MERIKSESPEEWRETVEMLIDKYLSLIEHHFMIEEAPHNEEWLSHTLAWLLLEFSHVGANHV